MNLEIKSDDNFEALVYMEDGHRVIVEFVRAVNPRSGALTAFMNECLANGKDFYIRDVSSDAMFSFVHKHDMQPVKSLTWDYVNPAGVVPYTEGNHSSWEAGVYAD